MDDAKPDQIHTLKILLAERLASNLSSTKGTFNIF